MTSFGFTPTSRFIRSAPVAPANCCPILDFRFIPPKVTNGGFGRIAIGDGDFHHIGNMEDFYASLGFQGDVTVRFLPEEFLWDRYRRDGATKSAWCLQIQIANYLYTHSAKFKKLFGRAYEDMRGKCQSHILDERDGQCLNCPMHPRSHH